MAWRFEWDPNKDKANQAKHGISFDVAALVFDDPLAVTVWDCIVDGEERWWTTGSPDGIRVLAVAITFRFHEDREAIRIISARKATPSERKVYEETSQ